MPCSSRKCLPNPALVKTVYSHTQINKQCCLSGTGSIGCTCGFSKRSEEGDNFVHCQTLPPLAKRMTSPNESKYSNRALFDILINPVGVSHSHLLRKTHLLKLKRQSCCHHKICCNDNENKYHQTLKPATVILHHVT